MGRWQHVIRHSLVAQADVDLFLIIHVGLHELLSYRPDYHFHNPLSLALIFGAGLCGLLHLLVLLISAYRVQSYQGGAAWKKPLEALACLG